MIRFWYKIDMKTHFIVEKQYYSTDWLVLFFGGQCLPKSAFAKAMADEGGAGGSRTRVRIRNSNVFYMFISMLIFVDSLVKSDRTKP